MEHYRYRSRKTMKILEMFAGKGGEIRRPMIEARGHTFVTLDIESKFNCTMTADIMDIQVGDLGLFDFVWASVPCETWSVSSMTFHWAGGRFAYVPKSAKAEYMIGLVQHTIRLLHDTTKFAWLIENPRGVLRKMPFMFAFPRHTVTYCQYGDFRMKPTDLWTCGLEQWHPKPMCKNGDPCHERAPRGSHVGGTQGMKSYEDKSVVPWQLWSEILDKLESQYEVA
jgi:hypothetical protein